MDHGCVGSNVKLQLWPDKIPVISRRLSGFREEKLCLLARNVELLCKN